MRIGGNICNIINKKIKLSFWRRRFDVVEKRYRKEVLRRYKGRTVCPTDELYSTAFKLAAKEADIVSRIVLPAMVEKLGWCHVIWFEMKDILNRRYGIVWQTPAEANPELDVD